MHVYIPQLVIDVRNEPQATDFVKAILIPLRIRFIVSIWSLPTFGRNCSRLSTCKMLYRPKIIDIRSGKVEDSLRDSVMNGIREEPRTLPTLILYGREGLQHWDDHSHAPDYYLLHEELHILRSRAYEMAETIADNTAMVDLGSAQVSRFHKSPLPAGADIS